MAIEVLASAIVVNAVNLHNKALGKKMDVTTFRESLVEGLCKYDEKNVPPLPASTHRIEEQDKRGRCVVCYTHFSERYGRAHASKNSKQCNTKCSACADKKFICLNCFFKTHNVSVK